MNTNVRKKLKQLSGAWRRMPPAQLIVLVFAVLVLLGGGLLTLPLSSRSGVSCGFLTALFTSTSATCVTGLVLADTWTQWSGFGQAVILLLIQIGGLGFMTVFSIFMLMLRKRFGMRNRLMISQAISLDSMDGVVRLIRHVILGTLLFEGIGALALTLRFSADFGLLKALRLGIFHAVSGFCNAGFDILGFLQPNGSLAPYAGDVTVNMTLMLLIVIGGMGFLVWEDLLRFRKTHRFSIYTKLVLVVTGILVFGGAALYALCEWNNPETIGSCSVGQKLLRCLFQSVTTRTAGFAAIDQGKLTEASKGITSFLMLIGGSSGSTAGGMKTVTVAVVFITALYAARGKNRVDVFRRSIPDKQIRSAYAVCALMLLLVLSGGIVLSAAGFSLTDAIYEAASALATVGLTTGITPLLPAFGKLLLILYMFFGRVGIMTISLGFAMSRKKDEQFHYAQTSLLIG